MQNWKRSRLRYFSWFKGPFKVQPIFLGVHCLISSILKNWLVEIKALGPNLHVSAIKCTIEGCAGSPYHDHQISWLCLSMTVCLFLFSCFWHYATLCLRPYCGSFCCLLGLFEHSCIPQKCSRKPFTNSSSPWGGISVSIFVFLPLC